MPRLAEALENELLPRSDLPARTRGRRGLRLLAWLPALLLIASGGLAHAQEAIEEDPEGPGPLPWRVGGRIGFTVDAATFPDSAGTDLQIYVRIPPATLRALVQDTTGSSLLRLSARLRGGRSQTTSQDIELTAADSVGGFGKVVLLRFTTRPGAHKLQVRLDDVRSRKRGLAYIGRQVNEFGRVEGEVLVPAAGPAGTRLSDVEFAWPQEGAGGAVFRHGERTVLPNPERLYGRFAPSLRLYFLARGQGGAPWRWSARVTDPSGRVVAQRDSSSDASPVLERELAVDLTGEPAGGYDVELSVAEGDAAPIVRRAHFSVAWLVDSWARNPRDIEDEVHFLLKHEEVERFVRMHPGEQERTLDDFWNARDPNPAVPGNPAREAFVQRIAYANRVYSRFGIGKGMFSDMGRVHIRYGEPDEVLRQVIPTGENTLADVLAQIVEEEDRPAVGVGKKGLGGDMRPFEVWIYEGDIPLPPDADPRIQRGAQRRRLVFLFVDQQGLGNYVLRYSTE